MQLYLIQSLGGVTGSGHEVGSRGGVTRRVSEVGSCDNVLSYFKPYSTAININCRCANKSMHRCSSGNVRDRMLPFITLPYYNDVTMMLN